MQIQQTPPVRALPKVKNALASPPLSSAQTRNYGARIRAISVNELPPNAFRRKREPKWRGGFSLGVDLGMSRTGLALSKGFNIRPLSVLELRGEKLEIQLLEIAQQESCDGKETPQSNKVRSVAGRLAVRAAERGWRVYLQDEHGTTAEAVDRMIGMGINRSTRQRRIDAYAAMMVLERYFSMAGHGTELVLPKNLDLQEKLITGPPKDVDFFPEEFER
ncbi:uncharacterized protein LOC133880326 isoform X2 [Alnus glutinosa]|uniref:uncharacterized protein LOC133880326 isoform X2 n=1 Tax=Alnus glutinosa TaxID=3517 RepID=UPI002D766E96|nr:uncharacterized protein LOC133880326 isoform X2 [Alnus glutinosa]